MDNWGKVKLGNILLESNQHSENPSASKRIRVLLNAKGVVQRPVQKETQGATKYFIRSKGQFIYGKQNIHKGAFGIIPDELDGFESTSDLPAFDVDNRCHPLWLEYYFKQGNFFLSLENIARGAATKRVQPKELLTLEIPLPSIEEQKAIISHIKNSETKDAELKSQINHQQTLLKKLRQQILQEAIEGKLSADWRQQNPKTEPASELLKRIQAEKAQLIKNKKIKPQKTLPPIRPEEKPFALPDGWEWCRLEKIIDNFLGGYAFKSTSFKKTGENQVLRIGNVRPYCILLGVKPVFIDRETAYEAESVKLKDGDLLITMTGTRKKRDYCYTALLQKTPTSKRSLFLNQRVGCLRFNEQICAQYYDYCLKHETLLDQIFSTATGSANQANIGSTALRLWSIPLPPLAEQKAIVAKVEKLLALCDQLESKINQSQHHANNLMQAVLQEAFAGASI